MAYDAKTDVVEIMRMYPHEDFLPGPIDHPMMHASSERADRGHHTEPQGTA